VTRYGTATLELVERIHAGGADHAVLLMRHSAREYEPGRHDLENPLTEAGREFARALGRELPKQLTLRAYASPPQRCMETAELVLAGHRDLGGAATRHRPLEALGVFYVLDQMKMWRGLREAGGLPAYFDAWFEGRVAGDTLMDPDLACRVLIDVLAEKLRSPVAESQLDVCVSHDMTLYLLRSRVLGVAPEAREVAYLDGLVLYENRGELRIAGLDGTEVTLSGGADYNR